MRLIAAVGILFSWSFAIDAEEAAVAVDVEKRLWAIELESYFNVYEDVAVSLRKTELELAQIDTRESSERLEEHRDKLRSHLDVIAGRAKEIAARLRRMDGESKRKKKLPDGTRVYLRERAKATGRSLDVAIEGSGFFRIVDPHTDEEFYTRTGRLDVDTDGNLVVGDSHPGLSLFPSIQLPKSAVSVVISKNGVVYARMPGETELRQLGQLQLSLFANPRGLVETDENLFAQTEESGSARVAKPGQDGAGMISQGCLEVSDSDRVRELIGQLDDLLTAQRAADPLSSQ